MRSYKFKRLHDKFMRRMQKMVSTITILIAFITSIALKINDAAVGGGSITIPLPSVTLSSISFILTCALISFRIMTIIEHNRAIDRKVEEMISTHTVPVVTKPEPLPVFKYSKVAKVAPDSDKKAEAKLRRQQQWKWGKNDVLDCRANQEAVVNIYDVLEHKNELLVTH